jgi:hypothetical protein
MCRDWAANANSCGDCAAGNGLIPVKSSLSGTSVHTLALYHYYKIRNRILMIQYVVCSMCHIISVISMSGSPSCLRDILCFFVLALCGPLQLFLLLRVHTTMFHLRHSYTAALIGLS